MQHPIEQRWNLRKPVTTEVILHSPRLGVVRARTRDLSYGGMRVDAMPATLGPNNWVRVTFIVHHDAETLRQSVDARVIHAGSHGCGLMFVDFNRDTFMLLHAFMFTENGTNQQRGSMAA